MNPDPGSISRWLRCLKAGDKSATEVLWNRFYPKLVRIANKKLVKNPDPAIGGEDIAQSSLGNVCQGVLDGRYPQLDNRDDFWRLLFVSMANRVCSHFRKCGSQKRNALLYLDEHSASSIAKTLQRRKTNILHKIQWIRAIWEEAVIHE